MILGFGYNISFKLLDRGLLEYLGPLGIIQIIQKLSKKISSFQTGFIYHYALMMIVGLISLMIIFNSSKYNYNGLTLVVSILFIYLQIKKTKNGKYNIRYVK